MGTAKEALKRSARGKRSKKSEPTIDLRPKIYDQTKGIHKFRLTAAPPKKPSPTFSYVMEVSESVVEYGIWTDPNGHTMTTVEAWDNYSPDMKRGRKLKTKFHAHSWELASAIYEYIMYKSAYKPMK